MRSDVLTFFGTTVAAIIALIAAVYTAQQSKKTQVQTAEEASSAVDRESQRRVQIELLNILRSEVEQLSQRVVDLRARLLSAEDSTDRERKLRRDMEIRVEELQDSLAKMLRLIATAIPDAQTQFPELFAHSRVAPRPATA